MNGHLPTALRPFLYGAQLHGLRKNNGDLRPIAVGCTYQCLVAKVYLRPYISRVRELLQPPSLRGGTPRDVNSLPMPHAPSWRKRKVKKFY